MADEAGAGMSHSSRSGRDFEWGREHEIACQMHVDGYTVREIGAKLDVSPQTISKWLKRPEGVERIEELKQEVMEQAKRMGLDKSRRLAALLRLKTKLERVIEARGEAEAGSSMPGGETGMVLRKMKALDSGDGMQVIEEFEVDTFTSKELREIMKQIAIECGEWTEKQELTGKDGAAFAFTISRVTKKEQ